VITKPADKSAQFKPVPFIIFYFNSLLDFLRRDKSIEKSLRTVLVQFPGNTPHSAPKQSAISQ
jgi:hypothetical protein